jgi:urea transport system permease protein
MPITNSKLAAVAMIVFFAILLLLPAFAGAFWLNRIATYLIYAICALAISMSWGYAGILNLGLGFFFGMGAYMLAMSLTLASPDNNPVPQLMLLNMEPDAMRDLCCITPGSFLWIPFRSLTVGILAGIAVPAAIAFVVGWVVFKRRTTGVYVSIITLALALIGQMLIINNQPLTGGFNGLAEFAPLTLFGFEFNPYGPSMYYLVVGCLAASLLVATWVLNGPIGRLLHAIRENESRVRFLGYAVENYQIFVFCFSAALAGIAGMLFTATAEFASPALMATAFSVSMVVWVAVGGKQSLIGACIGAVLVNMLGSWASENAVLQPVWPILLGLLFVLVVLYMPDGLAGIARRLFSVRPARPTPAKNTTENTWKAL